MATTTIDPVQPPTRLATLIHLMRGVWLQAWRRNELWVMVILMGLYLAGAVVMRVVGFENEQTARFVVGLGLELASLLAGVLLTVMSARQLSEELEMRTVYPLLAKPLTRTQLLLGKLLPCWLMAALALTIFIALVKLLTPGVSFQQPLVLIQALVLEWIGLAVLAMMTLWCSLWMPAAVAMLVSGGFYFVGKPMLTTLGRLTDFDGIMRLLPDFSLWRQLERYSEGGAPLGANMLLILLIYGVIWFAIFYLLAAGRFRRMNL